MAIFHGHRHADITIDGGDQSRVFDIDNGRLSYAHDGSDTVATSFGFSVSDGVNPPITGQTFAISINAVNDAPVNSVPAAKELEANHSLAITGLSIADMDVGAVP